MKIFFIALFFSCTLSTYAQLHDNNWITGNIAPNGNDSKMIFDFRENPPFVTPLPEIPFNTRITSTSYSNYFGDLLFYTNGQAIANKNHEIIENGEDLNPGLLADEWAQSGYVARQGVFFLPLPDNDSILYLFHQKYNFNAIVNHITTKILYSTIDQSANNGLGKVIEKNVEILTESPSEYEVFSIVRHANGRDWWILTADYVENRYYNQLFSPSGISTPIIQDIGNKMADTLRSFSNKVFSPDGSKYVDYDVWYGFDVYDFDRCSGLLSNAQRVNFADRPFQGGGAAFSSNNRFLYISTGRLVVQYDLETDNLAMNADTIAQLDSLGFCAFSDPPFLPNGFNSMQVAIDGKIYVYNSAHYNTIHVINKPDSLGSACQMEVCGYELPFSVQRTFPHFPNYRLYDLPDSPCDTLGIDGPPDPPVVATEEIEKRNREMVIFPNPTNGAMTIKLPFPSNKGDYLNIYNSIGQIVQQVQLEEFISNKQIDLINQSGLYIIEFISNDKTIDRKKVLVNK